MEIFANMKASAVGALRLLVVFLSLLAGLYSGGCSTPSDQQWGHLAHLGAPRVILISLDTLRADRLGFYGYERNTAPNLAALASESVVFTTVAAQAAQTLLSHKSMFTAKYPLRLIHETTNADLKKLISIDDPRSFLVNTFQDLKSESMVAGLRSHGYKTAALVDGGWMGRESGFAEGFDEFDQRGGHLVRILPRVYDWLSENRAERFFLFIHTYDIHCPYPCRKPYNSLFCSDHEKHISLAGRCGRRLMKMRLTDLDREAISNHYDGGIAGADAYLAELFAALKATNLYDETLLIVTSDHGESLGERQMIGHGGLYLEQLLVPLIIKFPASWGVASRIVERPAQLVDVMPTIYEACGLELPAGIDGRSLLRRSQEDRNEHRYLVAQLTYKEGRQQTSNLAKRAILDPGRWLLIHDARRQSAELFNLASDPQARFNMADKKPPELSSLVAQLASYDINPSSGEFLDPQPKPTDEETERRLRSLGYIGN